MIALAFAGHGAERPRMGAQLVGPDSPLIALAGREGRFDAAKLLRRGGPRLHDTAVVQPLLTAVNSTILASLAARGLSWQLCLGHSLGELAAWSAAGGITAEAAVTLAAARGATLARLARARPGAMLALNLPDEDLDAALALGRAKGIVDPAVHNAPSRWVLSGERPALAAIAQRHGGRYVANEGAWHSQLMAAGEDEFRAALRAAKPVDHRLPMIANQDGRLVEPGADMIEVFVAQLCGAVRWVACMQTLASTDVRELVLVGPSKALAGLVRDNLGAQIDDGRLRVHRVEDRADLERVCEVLA